MGEGGTPSQDKPPRGCLAAKPQELPPMLPRIAPPRSREHLHDLCEDFQPLAGLEGKLPPVRSSLHR